MTEFQIIKMTNLFNLLDADKNGKIQKDDFDLILSRISILLDLDVESSEFQKLRERYDQRWNKISEYADTNKDGLVTFKEWIDYCKVVLSSEEEYNNHITHIVNFVFDLLDEDGNGGISINELKMFYDAYGLDPKIANQTFPILDLNSDGKITIDELNILCGQFHKSNDKKDPGNHFFGYLN
jgi:Ca2+-binding EF-hand superfamily protein